MAHRNNTGAVLETGRESADLLGALRSRIRSGELAPGTFLPTVRKLSQTEGVAHGTAWRALKTLEAEGLVEARPRRGYRVVAAEERGAGGGTLAYVMDQRNVAEGSSERLYIRLLGELQSCAGRSGARVLKLIMNRGEEQLVFGQLASAGLSGLVLDSLNPALLGWAREADVPVVVVDDWAADLDCDSVVQDGAAGGELAAGHLVGKGCRRIAWLGHVGNQHGRARYGGAAAGLAAAGQRFFREENCEMTEEAFSAAAERLFSGREKPDGVVVFWRQAYGPLVRSARAAGLELGRELEAVCWCPAETLDARQAALFEGAQAPPAVAWSIRSMAELALARLVERGRSPHLPASSTRLPVRLLSHGSAEKTGRRAAGVKGGSR